MRINRNPAVTVCLLVLALTQAGSMLLAVEPSGSSKKGREPSVEEQAQLEKLKPIHEQANAWVKQGK
jgi:hypothetical protein